MIEKIIERTQGNVIYRRWDIKPHFYCAAHPEEEMMLSPTRNRLDCPFCGNDISKEEIMNFLMTI